MVKRSILADGANKSNQKQATIEHAFKKQKTEDVDSQDVPKFAVPPPATTTIGELREVSAAVALSTLSRLINGYTDKSKSGYPAATTNSSGCTLAQKSPNRADNGYVQITPISSATRSGTVNGTVKAKPKPQNAHRLAVVAHKGAQDRTNLLDNGYHASHRCHNPTCINPDHIVVETKANNEGRKRCRQEFWLVELGGVAIAQSVFKCACVPRCIPRVLVGEAVE